MLGVSMCLTFDHLPANIELYGHIFDVHLLGLETDELAVENKSVSYIHRENKFILHN